GGASAHPPRRIGRERPAAAARRPVEAVSRAGGGIHEPERGRSSTPFSHRKYFCFEGKFFFDHRCGRAAPVEKSVARYTFRIHLPTDLHLLPAVPGAGEAALPHARPGR